MKAADEVTSILSRQLGTFPDRALPGLIHFINKVLVASQIFIFCVEQERAPFLSSLLMTPVGMVPMKSDCIRGDFLLCDFD